MPRIMIVDSDRAATSAIRVFLEHEGYQVFVSEAEAAAPSAVKGDVDVAVVDITAPGVKGLSAIEALRTRAPNVAIIAVFDAANLVGPGQALVADAAALGASAALAKPFRPRQLIEAIEACIGSANADAGAPRWPPPPSVAGSEAATRRARVLLVEDNPGDVDLAREALQGGRLNVDLRVASDSVQALKMLRPSAAAAERPDLILLDLNLPGKDGRELLAEIKGDPDLKATPVVVITSSKQEEDVARSYAVGANCYVIKPTALDAFASVVRAIGEFWLSAVKLPPLAEHGWR